MMGQGKLSWSDNKFYEGNFVNDKRNGFGIFSWANGRKYEGHWKDGQGTFTTDKGVTKNNRYCLKDIVVFINENCKGYSYIIDISGHNRPNTLYVIFGDENDRVSFKLNFNGFTTKIVDDAFK